MALNLLTYDAKTNSYTVEDRSKQATADDFNDIKSVVNAVVNYLNSKDIYKQTTDVTIANSAVETTLFSGNQASRTIPANTLVAGDIIIVETSGKMSTYNSSQKAQVKFKLGSTDLLDSSLLQLNSTKTLTNDLFVNRFFIRVLSTGESGSVQCTGYTLIHPGTGIIEMTSREILGAVKTIDTTADIVIDETYTWENAFADNSITMSIVRIFKA